MHSRLKNSKTILLAAKDLHCECNNEISLFTTLRPREFANRRGMRDGNQRDDRFIAGTDRIRERERAENLSQCACTGASRLVESHVGLHAAPIETFKSVNIDDDERCSRARSLSRTSGKRVFAVHCIPRTFARIQMRASRRHFPPN